MAPACDLLFRGGPLLGQPAAQRPASAPPNALYTFGSRRFPTRALPHHRHCSEGPRYGYGRVTRCNAAPAPAAVLAENQVKGMTAFLDSLKWDTNGLVVAIAQHVDNGEVLMQAFADRAAVCETLQTGCVRPPRLPCALHSAP
jgi:hypothetical protein